MVATLNNQPSGGETISREVLLDEGDYAVFVRLLGDAQPENAWCANARVTAALAGGGEVVIGIAKGNVPKGPPGWTWRTAGPYRSDGRPFRLVIEATNDDHLPRAYLHLDRVAFVRPGTSVEALR